MKTTFETIDGQNYKVTDCDDVHQMVCNILNEAAPDIFRYESFFEIKIQTRIAQCLIKGFTEEKTYTETRKYVKNKLREYFDLDKFNEHYKRYARPKVNL